MVTHYISVPLRPLRLRPALAEARKKWKQIAGSGFLTAVLPFVVGGLAAVAAFAGVFLTMMVFYPLTQSVAAAAITGAGAAAVAGFFMFFAAYTVWILVPDVVMLEKVGVREALKRSRALVKRSFTTAAGAVIITILIPAIVAGSISLFVNLSGKALDPTIQTGHEINTPAEPETGQPSDNPDNEKRTINYSFGRAPGVSLIGDNRDMTSRLKTAVLESLIQVLWLPMQIIVFSFSAIIVALLYLKTRMAGGESKDDLIERFEDDDRPRKKWQERVRQRLIQSGRIPSKP
jgi:hypothetical protein